MLQCDTETGTNQNYMRSYWPMHGAFNQFDPTGLDGGLDKRGYAGGNALTYTDPMGLQHDARPPKRPNRPGWWDELWAPTTNARHCATAECAAGFSNTSSSARAEPTEGLTCTARFGLGLGVTATYNSKNGLTYLGLGPQLGLSISVTGGGMTLVTGDGASGLVVQASGAFGNGVFGLSGNAAAGASGTTATGSPGVGTIGVSAGVTMG